MWASVPRDAMLHRHRWRPMQVKHSVFRVSFVFPLCVLFLCFCVSSSVLLLRDVLRQGDVAHAAHMPEMPARSRWKLWQGHVQRREEFFLFSLSLSFSLFYSFLLLLYINLFYFFYSFYLSFFFLTVVLCEIEDSPGHRKFEAKRGWAAQLCLAWHLVFGDPEALVPCAQKHSRSCLGEAQVLCLASLFVKLFSLSPSLYVSLYILIILSPIFYIYIYIYSLSLSLWVSLSESLLQLWSSTHSSPFRTGSHCSQRGHRREAALLQIFSKHKGTLTQSTYLCSAIPWIER